MTDRDIYFDDKIKENLIVVGGTSINKLTTRINNKLRIQYVKMKNYKDGHYNDYLVDRSKDSFKRTPCHDSERKMPVGSIQIIRNPYSELVTNPTYIIVIFGLNRAGTKIAGIKFIELWINEFYENIINSKQNKYAWLYPRN